VLLYATGARRAEAACIKVEDIDSQPMVIHIRQGSRPFIFGAHRGLLPTLQLCFSERLGATWRFPSTANWQWIERGPNVL
jgi:integrase